MNAIETHNLTKVYNNNFTAVNSLNLEIPDKSIFGMLGPNGAGKTTIMKLLANIIGKDDGMIEYENVDISIIGVVIFIKFLFLNLFLELKK